VAKKTQGTMLYLIVPVDEDNPAADLLRVGCVTNLTGLGAPRDQIETTCLESLARTYEPGMPTPGTATFTINFEPEDASHLAVHALYRSGVKIDWAIGWSDGTSEPTLGSEDGFDITDTRTWILFNGFVADVPFDFALNTVVTSNISIQLSDFPEIFPRTAT
jgi:hypothetical protein